MNKNIICILGVFFLTQLFATTNIKVVKITYSTFYGNGRFAHLLESKLPYIRKNIKQFISLNKNARVVDKNPDYVIYTNISNIMQNTREEELYKNRLTRQYHVNVAMDVNIFNTKTHRKVAFFTSYGASEVDDNVNLGGKKKLKLVSVVNDVVEQLIVDTQLKMNKQKLLKQIN